MRPCGSMSLGVGAQATKTLLGSGRIIHQPSSSGCLSLFTSKGKRYDQRTHFLVIGARLYSCRCHSRKYVHTHTRNEQWI
jgi:hypothetical protein